MYIHTVCYFRALTKEQCVQLIFLALPHLCVQIYIHIVRLYRKLTSITDSCNYVFSQLIDSVQIEFS